MTFEKRQTLPTLAFVDLDAHKQTRSTDFFRELLCESFRVTNFWWTWGAHEKVTPDVLNSYEYVVFCQVLYPIGDLRSLRTRVLWAPMYDGESFNYGFWKQLAALQVRLISFSGRMHQHARRFGIESLPVQYFADPSPYPRRSREEKATVFFWDRGDLPHDVIARLFVPDQVSRFIYRGILGRKATEPSLLARNYRMEYVPSQLLPRDEYVRLVEAADVYVAPRRKEGIGLTFLEALAMGKCIVAYDDATMNEYITHGLNGFLFSDNGPFPLDLRKIRSMRAEIDKLRSDGYARWIEDTRAIPAFILRSPTKAQHATGCRLAWWGIVRLLCNVARGCSALARGDMEQIVGVIRSRLRRNVKNIR